MADPVVRAGAVEVLRALRLGDAALYARTLDAPDTGVRQQTVRALISVDALPELVRAGADPSREVRAYASRVSTT
ncbi:hypothetical protein AB0O07_28825 [Streptomyces sp. NPDC093085]|uniref:hypothetical protein n=1 Tax=Streptomyces sp. NPDC093085 TaxID=3155068 RepID=UPI0034158E93